MLYGDLRDGGAFEMYNLTWFLAELTLSQTWASLYPGDEAYFLA